MSKLLHIGEVAHLLGVTPKAIRHYQKIGLLQEPERSASGYRLYGAPELLRLHHIRRLQSLGLSLKQIKTILGEPEHQRSLRTVLQALDQELTTRIQALEEQRRQLRTLLDDPELEHVDQLPVESPTFEAVKALLGDLVATVSPELMQQEARMDALFDAFQWPLGQTAMQHIMVQVAAQFKQRPELYRQLLTLADMFVALAPLPEDAPEVDHLIEQCASHPSFAQFVQEMMSLSTQVPQMDERYSQLLSEMMTGTLSPAQLRFLREMQNKFKG